MTAATTNWTKATERARQLMTNRVHFSFTFDKYEATEGRQTFFLVDSATAEGERYSVCVVERDNHVETNCTCPCGQRGRYGCWHVASVLIVMGLMDDARIAA